MVFVFHSSASSTGNAVLIRLLRMFPQQNAMGFSEYKATRQLCVSSDHFRRFGHSSGKVPGWFGGRFQSFWERDRLGSPKQHQLGEWFKFCPQQNLAVGDITWASKSNIRIPWEWGQRPCEGCKLWHWGLGCGPRLLHISSRHRVSTTDTVRYYRYDLMCISVFYICIIYKHTHK